MKFAHIADCHIGGWRDPRMKDLPLRAFVAAIDRSVDKNVDFILISGDLFNTSHPAIDNLKVVVSKLRELKEKDIPLYIIAGSHDFSATGKTMLDVLEEARLAINVVRGSVSGGKLHLEFTTDRKTGAKITGMLGKKGSLEKKFYETLDKTNLKKEEGFKIFMFHTSISELKPKSLEKMESAPISLLPRGFDYYAGGHVHIVEKRNLEGYKNIVYPGPLFPNNFRELEELKEGGFYIYDDGDTGFESVHLCNVEAFCFDAKNKTPEKVTEEVMSKISNREFINTIVLLRIEGELISGRPSDIDFSRIFKTLYEKSAYFVMRNTAKLTSKEFEEVMVKEDSVEKIEEKLIDEHKRDSGIFDDEKKEIKALMKALSSEKGEDEKSSEYEKRISDDVDRILEL